MPINKTSDNVIYLDLPRGSFHIRNEFEALNQITSEKGDCDIILDLAKVEILNSINISNLLILRKLIEDHDRKLILCNVAYLTKQIFEISGLTEMFNFANSKDEALKTARNSKPVTRKS